MAYQKYRLSLSLPYPGEDISHWEEVSLGGHNRLFLSPNRRFIKKELYPIIQFRMPKRHRQPEQPSQQVIDKSPYIHREAKREQAASQLARIVGLETPEVSIHSHMPYPITVSHFLQNAEPLIDHLDLDNWEDSAREALQKLDNKSVINSALFNYMINHRDAHVRNFLVNNNHLLPIDFGMSFIRGHEEPIPVREHENTIAQFHLKPYAKRLIDKEITRPYVDHADKLRDIVAEQIAPAYKLPYEQQNVMHDFERRLSDIKDLHNKPNAMYNDLLMLVAPPVVSSSRNKPSVDPNLQATNIDNPKDRVIPADQTNNPIKTSTLKKQFLPTGPSPIGPNP